MTQVQPSRPITAKLITKTEYALGSLYYIWMQSRHNNPLPSPREIEEVLVAPTLFDKFGQYQGEEEPFNRLIETWRLLGYEWKTKDAKSCAIEAHRHVRDTLKMLLGEAIPVTEPITFSFHLDNVPISFREQAVRHRIGTSFDPRVGADIIPEPIRQMMLDAPAGSFLDVKVVPDQSQSSFWAQTSRVVPATNFFDEGRYFVPPSLKGKTVTSTDPMNPFDCDAEAFYISFMNEVQEAYRMLVAAGVHIEDARQIMPVGSTHSLVWTMNLKAMLHILGKRTSWIAQAGMWAPVIEQMGRLLISEVHPMFSLVMMPQCIKKGQYTTCPVNGTNVERVNGLDGMPPCPLWIRYQTDDAIKASQAVEQGLIPGRKEPAWTPPMEPEMVQGVATGEWLTRSDSTDVRSWSPLDPVQAEMLERNAADFEPLWGFNPMEPIPADL